MIKKMLAAILSLLAAAAFAAVDVNRATQAELESIKGIGPVISAKILDERKKGAFKDWEDMVTRVKGVGEGNAAKFSADGLTVNGATFKGVAAPMKKEERTSVKTAAPGSAEPSAPKAPKTAETAPPKSLATKDVKEPAPAASPAAEMRKAKAEAKAEAKAAKAKKKEEKSGKNESA